MDFIDALTIPKRAELKFGVPLEELCERGVFHEGLKDLFLKAYASAEEEGYQCEGEEEDEEEKPGVLRALKSGSGGQGSLSQRLRLKGRAEAGEWLLPAQTPPGAPLWLLRHFLGRLPQPLLRDGIWRQLARLCGRGSDEVDSRGTIARIALSARALNQLEFETLALLALLVRNLCLKKRTEELHDEALNALGQYFIASIIARPFRPGLYTGLDKECQPLLVFLARHWRLVFQESAEAPICATPSQAELEERIWNHAAQLGRRKSYSKFIGFESFLIIQDNEESKESSETDVDSDCLHIKMRIANDDLNMIKRDLALSRKNAMRKVLRDESSPRRKDPNIENIISEVEALNAELKQKFEAKNRMTKERLFSQISASDFFNSKANDICESEERARNVGLKSDCRDDTLLLNEGRENLISRFGDRRLIGKPIFTDDEFFSVCDSEESEFSN